MNIRDPFSGYDQWKTASPYDDEADPYEVVEALIKAIDAAMPRIFD